MLIRRLRQSLQREEGQALVLGCLMVLVLSIAVLTTVNIGHTVHERVRLQNTADAAAYSMAAMEARAFNFYAFANRTQVSHYVSAMVWQSFDSFLYFLQAFLVDIAGIMLTVDQCASPSNLFWKAACPLLEAVPYLGEVIQIINQIITAYLAFLDGITFVWMDPSGNAGIVDKAIGKLVNGHRDLNMFLAGASTAVMESALEHIIGPGNDVLAAGTVAENDPNLGVQTLNLPMTFVNACYFDRAHYREANGSPFKPANPFSSSATDHISPATTSSMGELDRIARAKRVMGAITDATRFGCDTSAGAGPISALCPDSFVTARRLGDLLPKLSIFGGNLLGPLTGFLNTLPKWGQTKFQSYEQEFGKDGYSTAIPTNKHPKSKSCFSSGGYGSWNGSNRIREWQNTPGAENGEMAQGDNLGSDDIYYIGVPIQIPGFANPLACDKDDDWGSCWGDPRALFPGKANPSKYQGSRYMPMKTSIWAINKTEQSDKGINGGLHWRVTKGNDSTHGNIGISKAKKKVGLSLCGFCIPPTCFKIDVFFANVQPEIEPWHTWDGLVPFSHFEPGQFQKACGEQFSVRGSLVDDKTAADRTMDFNQPSQFALFHKDPKEMRNPKADNTGGTTNAPAMLNDDGELTWNFGGSSQKLVMDDTRQKTFGFVSGVTVLSRGQTYYHRPGNWSEMPNFFNPYWKPRLASVYQGRNELPFLGTLLNALPGPFKSIEQKLVTH